LIFQSPSLTSSLPQKTYAKSFFVQFCKIIYVCAICRHHITYKYNLYLRIMLLNTRENQLIPSDKCDPDIFIFINLYLRTRDVWINYSIITILLSNVIHYYFWILWIYIGFVVIIIIVLLDSFSYILFSYNFNLNGDDIQNVAYFFDNYLTKRDSSTYEYSSYCIYLMPITQRYILHRTLQTTFWTVHKQHRAHLN